MSINRREFLVRSTKTLLGVAAGGSMLSLSGCAMRQFAASEIPDHRILADLHVHCSINAWNRQTPLGIEYPALAFVAKNFVNKTGMNWAKCHAAGIDMVCAAHFNVFDEWLSMPTDPNPHAPANTHRMLDQLEAHLRGPAAPYGKIAHNRKELETLLSIPKSDAAYRIAVVHTLEGGHALGGNIAALEPLAARGVASITLTHFFNKGIASAANSYPFFPDANSSWPYQGLSAFGRDVLMEMERLGIIADVIHCTTTAIEDVLKTATKPLIASHASARTLSDHPYSLLDEHIRQITRDGGIIGIIIDPYLLSNYSSAGEAEAKGTISDVVRNIRYVVKICGSHKHVGIGSDFAGYTTDPQHLNSLSHIGKLTKMLQDEFGDEQIVADIMANNVIEFYQKNWRYGQA